ncbi:hypothetical protein HYD90_03455 [Mycoplasmopsis bovis]|nr:hypothetical protein [Mycoplasmopsis bovis]QQH35781.1 hypothetical protein HYD90_03455 [Mycoplasmopsis bovis]
MKKKIKKLNIFSSLSFLPLMPLVSCLLARKMVMMKKFRIINNESDPQTIKTDDPPPLILMVDQSKWWFNAIVDKTTDC